jgi:XTP/dITP diphosphohydrolase
MQIVLASGNKGKIKEILALVKPYGITITPQSEFGINDAEESGLSFVENAIIKARHAASQAQMPALADDSGLVVPILKGRPGIHSARYAGATAQSTQNIQKLLAELKLVPEADRTAFFYCVMIFMHHEHDPCPLIGEGIWHGRILLQPQGTQGFGYDPIFYDMTQSATAAELAPEIKNQLSHRGQALRKLVAKFAPVI